MTDIFYALSQSTDPDWDGTTVEQPDVHLLSLTVYLFH